MRDDVLPSSGSYVLNLDIKSGQGTHWVAVYENEYFDSYGLPAPNKLSDKILVNKRKLQLARDTCGEWSCLYIMLRNLGVSPYKICYEIFISI